jgi:hypothetical protein
MTALVLDDADRLACNSICIRLHAYTACAVSHCDSPIPLLPPCISHQCCLKRIELCAAVLEALLKGAMHACRRWWMHCKRCTVMTSKPATFLVRCSCSSSILEAQCAAHMSLGHGRLLYCSAGMRQTTGRMARTSMYGNIYGAVTVHGCCSRQPRRKEDPRLCDL